MCDLREPSRLDERELAELEALTEHPDLATAAALDYCAEENVRPPGWVVKRAASLMSELLKRERAGKAGRAVGRLARYRQDQWDAERSEAIEEMRRIRLKVRNELKLIKSEGLSRSSAHARNCERLE